MNPSIRGAIAFALVLACQGQAPRSISVGDVSVPVVVKPEFYANCVDAATTLSGKEVAFAAIYYKFAAVPDRTNPSRRVFVAAVDEQKSYIQLPQPTWPTVSAKDDENLARLDSALAWHERGHLAIAVALAEEVTAAQHPIASNADGVAQVKALFAASNQRQTAYDALVTHGIHQSLAPEPLRGADTRFYCR
jgi:hypothetical protein